MHRSVVRRPVASLLLALALAACHGDGGGGGGGDLTFSAEAPFLPGLDLDSGYVPDGSPVAVRATATASGGISITTGARSDGDTLEPVAGSGAIAIQGAIALEVSTRIDTAGIMYEGVVSSFDYALDPAMQTFEPFALDAPVTVMSMLPAKELGSVPIPSVPGGSLVLSVTGGQITTAFGGTCADAAAGFAQYTGTLTTQGTVSCSATVEIEVPIVGTQSFGPFAFDLPIPEIVSPIDLGTRSIATGEAAASMGICDGDGGGSGDDGGATSGAGATSGGADDSTGHASGPEGTSSGGSDSGNLTGVGTTLDPSAGDATGGTSEDPDYPSPYFPGGCPVGTVGVGVGVEPANGVCLPACSDGQCPSGITGSATGVCGFNPNATYASCSDDTTCAMGETCSNGYCMLPPSHCVLTCDVGWVCPDDMNCVSGVCSYLQ